MKKLAPAILAAVLGSVSMLAVVSPAAANPRGEQQQRMERPGSERGEHGQRMGRHAPNPSAGLLNFVCSERGATRLERMLGALAERLELTDQQTPLFETFRTQALTAQTAFADGCAAERPTNLLDRLTQRQDRLGAQLQAWEAVMPSFAAFYQSLDADQQAKFERRGKRGMGERGHDRMHQRHHGERPGMERRGPPRPGMNRPGTERPAPDAAQPSAGQPPAPATPPAPPTNG